MREEIRVRAWTMYSTRDPKDGIQTLIYDGDGTWTYTMGWKDGKPVPVKHTKVSGVWGL